MKNYKQWTPADRWRNLRLYKDALRLGLWNEPKKCRFCGQRHGILQTHCTDYDVSLNGLPKVLDGTISADEREKLEDVLIPVCWRCHMMIHKAEYHPLSSQYYFKLVKDGARFKPVFRPDAWEELEQFLID